MKLIVTVGNAAGESEELVFDVSDPITYLGVEIEALESPTGRMTIMRTPFSLGHDNLRIHTICGRDETGALRVTELGW